MHAVYALAVKDIRLLCRDKAGLFFTVGLPLLFAAFFGSMFGGGGGGGGGKIAIAVTDEDRSDASRRFVETLSGSAELNVTPLPREAGIEQVRGGKKSALVVIPPGFGAARDSLFFGDPPRLLIGADPSRQAENGMLAGLLTKFMAERFQEAFSDSGRMLDAARRSRETLLADPDLEPAVKLPLQALFAQVEVLSKFLPDPAAGSAAAPTASSQPAAADGAASNAAADSRRGGFSAFEPVRIESLDIRRQRRGPTNPYAISFTQGIVWGLMGCAAGFGISLVVERTHGTLRRLRIAPVSQAQILAGKALACFVTTVSVSIVLLVAARLVFNVRPTSPPLLAVAVLCCALCFVGLMMLLSVLGRTEQSAGGIGWAVLLVLGMIGGAMVPQFAMPAWMQQLGSISPIKWAVVALEGALWRDFTASAMALPCAMLLAFGAVCFAVGVQVFRRMEA